MFDPSPIPESGMRFDSVYYYVVLRWTALGRDVRYVRPWIDPVTQRTTGHAWRTSRGRKSCTFGCRRRSSTASVARPTSTSSSRAHGRAERSSVPSSSGRHGGSGRSRNARASSPDTPPARHPVWSWPTTRGGWAGWKVEAGWSILLCPAAHRGPPFLWAPIPQSGVDRAAPSGRAGVGGRRRSAPSWPWRPARQGVIYHVPEQYDPSNCLIDSEMARRRAARSRRSE